MIATIQKQNDVFIATFEREYPHPIEKVWAMLTDNEQLPRWFPELRVADLRIGGHLTFDMQDGTFEEMRITDYKEMSILEYTWGADRVRFELSPTINGTRLLLIETITQWTAHTPKDLAGWHVCLDVITALLDGKQMDNRKEEWQKWFEKYDNLMRE